MPATFTIKRVSDRYPIWHTLFQEQRELMLTYMRLQEHYESPKFRGQVFTHAEYVEWYKSEHDGEFTYPEDWTGTNVPSTAVRSWRDKFRPHDAREQALLDALRQERIFRHRRFYLIGTYVEDRPDGETTLDHELAHGRFHCDPKYAADMTAGVARHDVTSLHRELATLGYHESVIVDEIQANALSGWYDGLVVTPELVALSDDLKIIEQKFL